jgi:hypothetical protein
MTCDSYKNLQCVTHVINFGLVQTPPKITSLIANPAFLAIGMIADDKKMHNRFLVMQIHAQLMQKFVLKKVAMQN